MDFFTIMIILITLVVFVFIVLIAFVMKKSKDTASQEFFETERKGMLQNVAKRRKKLVAHKAEFYLQLTNAMVFERVTDVRTITISGTLYNTDRKPIVAFERVERGKNATGQLVAMTKKQTFVYEFLDADFTIFCDGKLLGSWNKSGVLLDVNQRKIGAFKRTTTVHNLILNDRTIATVQKAPLHDHIARITEVSEVFEELNHGTSLLSLNDSPTAEEEKWLTALVIFEITFYGNTPVA
jgi:hypothetical protein